MNISNFGFAGNIPTDLTGYVPTSRTITINGVTYDLSANRTWNVGDLLSSGSYANPTWLTSLAWSKITGTPTTLAGYGITDAVPSNRTLTINGTSYDLSANRTWSVGDLLSSGSYANPTWLTSLAWSKITNTPTTLAGYGITNAVPSTRTLTINGTAQDLSADRTWTIPIATITDITASCTYTGWASFTEKQVISVVIGNFVMIFYRVNGTSNSTSTSITLPYTNQYTYVAGNMTYALNNGAIVSPFGTAGMVNNSAVLVFTNNNTGSTTSWTASGGKLVNGQIAFTKQ
jgi:predicted heme/steroid binding protein